MKTRSPASCGDLRPIRPDEIGRLDLEALPFTGRIINDAKVSDHHAIIPTGKRPGELAPAAQKVFDAVVTRLIAAFYPACVKEVTTVAGESNEVPFRARGVRVLDPGWTVLYPREDDDKERRGRAGAARVPPRRERPARAVRQGGRDDAAEALHREAACSGRWRRRASWSTTSSSRRRSRSGAWARRRRGPSIIETLLERGYIARDKKTLTATDLGRYLVALVQDRAPEERGADGRVGGEAAGDRARALDPRRFMAEIVRYTAGIIRSGDAVTDRRGPARRLPARAAGP